MILDRYKFFHLQIKCLLTDNCFFAFRDLCYQAWSNLRKSPMFGCICPNNHMKKRCDRIFSMVNHNPCVGESENFRRCCCSIDCSCNSRHFPRPCPIPSPLDLLCRRIKSNKMPELIPQIEVYRSPLLG